MELVQKHHIKPNTQQYKDIVVLSDACKKLYKQCIKYIKDFQKNNDGNLYKIKADGKKEWCFNNSHLFHVFKNTKYFNVIHNNKRINTKILKQVFIQINESYSSYFKSIKEYYKNKSKFKRKPKQPSFRSNSSMMAITIPKDAYSIPMLRNHGLITNISNTSIKVNVNNLQEKGYEIRQVKLVPCTYGYIVNVLYFNETTKSGDVKEKKVVSRLCGIDIGLANLASVTYNVSDIQPFLIDGKKLDIINNFYFKKKAILKDKLSKGLSTSQKLNKLYLKRCNKINDYIHKASRIIINQLLKNYIDCLVIGSNKNWKQKINIGRKNNRRFCGIPFDKFKNMLKYKCEMNGILYIDREESYTSKCSFIDMEDICKHDKYIGNRYKRGLFKSKDGKIINSDVNGSLNIIRKEFGNEYFNWDTVYKLYSNVKRLYV